MPKNEKIKSKDTHLEKQSWEEMFPDNTAEDEYKELLERVKRHDRRRAEALKRGMTLEEFKASDKGTSGFKKGGTVRGAGIARKGVRPCKMR